MKKLVITLAAALIIATAGCGDSKSPILTYVARSTSDNAPHLFILNEATKTPTAVQISIPSDALFVASNSNATAVAYCRNGSSGWDIFLMGTDNVEHELTTGADACESVFSPDTKTIAYVSCATDCLIMTMNVDGTNQKAVYTPPAGTAQSFYPEYSADGKSLVFYVDATGGPSAQNRSAASRSPWFAQARHVRTGVHPATASGVTSSGWYAMALTDSAPTLVYATTSLRGPAVLYGDGSKLLLTQNDGTTFNIFSVNLDGSGLTPLTASTDSSIWEFSPVPYKNLIVFNQSNPANSSWDIYVMNPDGSNPQLIHSTANTSETLLDSYSGG